MSKTPFLERLEQNRPLLGDGAMGTLLHARGVKLDSCFDEMNVKRPELIRGVHADYIAAGAEMIETNTFSANRYKLMDCGLEDQVAAINRAGAKLAREAVEASGREDVYVAGSMGPLGVGIQPYGRIQPEDAYTAFVEQIGGLVEGGVDVILFETFNDLNEMLVALKAARDIAPTLPVICQMTFATDDRTLLGHLPGRVARELAEAGANVIGVNCSGGPEQISRILQTMRIAAPDVLTSAMPNAGFPQHVGGRMMYGATEEYFADYALTFKAIGAAIIGGCCGTTPSHIAAMRRALDDTSRTLPKVQILETHDEEEQDVADEHPTEMSRKMAAGKFVVSVEMTPPRSYSVSRILESAQLLQDAGADVVNVADSPTARMRMSPWAVCHLLQSRLGLETVLHFPTRGRNLLRIQGDLLGAHALGLRNIFVCMGDPTKIGDYPEAMDNYDIVPTGLIKLVTQRLNEGSDQAGNSIGQPTAFNVGCALNMNAADVDKEIDLLRKKLDAGANFALAQPVFEPHIVENFLRRYEEVMGETLRFPVLMGIMPLYSMKHARFLNNEIPGINIPQAILTRIEDAGDDAAQEGVRVAQELLRQMRGLVQGAYLMPAFGRYNLAAQVLDALAVPSMR
jgi:methionine synthase / methylenetetrahydrofolate reductase(NADPH)